MNEIQKMPDSEGKKISEFDRKQQNEVQALVFRNIFITID